SSTAYLFVAPMDISHTYGKWRFTFINYFETLYHTFFKSSNNILIQSGIPKIAICSLSNALAQISSKSETSVAYIDPSSFRNLSYEWNKKSDVFSLGVIL